MIEYRAIFKKLESFLKKHFGKKLNIEIDEYKGGYVETRLNIKDSHIWFSYDDKEFIIGRGFYHQHYSTEYGNLNEMIDDFFNLLTKRKRITEYYKGEHCYKTKFEIEFEESKFKLFSSSSNLSFILFWKKTQKKVNYEEKLINQSSIQVEINEIKKALLKK